jgi:nitronate monooxygenase
VSDAGGLGFLAGGYLTADALRDQIQQVRASTPAVFGANLFVPNATTVDASAVAAFARRITPEAERFGVGLGDPLGGDDHFTDKVAVLVQERVPVVSFAFGLPGPDVMAALRAAGATVLVTVTTPAEAVTAALAGADALVAQGIEAGAHRGGFTDVDGVGEYGVLALLRLVCTTTSLPVVAAGGLVDGAGIAAVLVGGAVAAQLGTAFLRCPEAGTSDLHRAALAREADAVAPGETALTRAFTGRRARGLVNRFLAEHTAAAPSAYPHVHQLTAPLRNAARSAGDTGAVALWAGQGYPLARELPAGELVRRLSEEARAALARTLS